MSLPKRVFRPWRIRLSWLLAIWLVGGALLGFWLRSYMNEPKHHTEWRAVGGFKVRSMWEQRYREPERLVYIIAYPRANHYGGGTSPSMYDTPGKQGVEIHPLGLMVKGDNRTIGSNVKVWLYLPIHPDGDIRPLEETLNYPELTRADFRNLEALPVWKEVVLPALEEETELRGWKLPKKATPPANSPRAVGEHGASVRQTAQR